MARDYYDLWCIFKKYSTIVNHEMLIEVLNKKCIYRDVSYQQVDDFFTPELIKEANRHWQAGLGALVRELPECKEVLDETRVFVKKVLYKSV